MEFTGGHPSPPVPLLTLWRHVLSLSFLTLWAPLVLTAYMVDTRRRAACMELWFPSSCEWQPLRSPCWVHQIPVLRLCTALPLALSLHHLSGKEVVNCCSEGSPPHALLCIDCLLASIDLHPLTVPIEWSSCVGFLQVMGFFTCLLENCESYQTMVPVTLLLLYHGAYLERPLIMTSRVCSWVKTVDYFSSWIVSVGTSATMKLAGKNKTLRSAPAW